jgi:parallel beta-helix repeat protein
MTVIKVFVLMQLMLLCCALFFITVDTAISAEYGVHNLDSGLDYATIQAALDASETSSGDRILVDEGTYYEHVVVRKSVTLAGQDKTTTIIDACMNGSGIIVRSSNVEVSGFTVRNSGAIGSGDTGVLLDNVENCTLRNIEVVDSRYGFRLVHSGGNVLEQCIATRNSYNFRVSGRYLSHFINNIDPSNNVDGKPIYYLVNKHNEQVPSDAGYVVVVNSTKITLQDLVLSRNGQGIMFAFVRESTIRNVSVTNSYDGINLVDCENCTVAECDTSQNGQFGIELQRSIGCSLVNNSANENGYENKYLG